MNLPNLQQLAMIVLTAVVAACGGSSGGGSNVDIPRVTSGQPDPGYGEAGRVTFETFFGAHFGLAVDAAGNAYVGGSSILKLDPAGHVVRSYGGVGYVDMQAHRLLVGDAGNLFAISDGLRLIEVDASGRLVPSFGDGTIVGLVGALVRNVDGGFYAVGNAPGGAIMVMKFDREGRIDPTYGVGGSRVVDSGGTNQSAHVAAVDRQGNLYVAGEELGDELVMLVLKLDPNGNLVPDFGTAGAWRSPRCSDFRGAMAIAVDGANVYVGGTCSPTSGGVGQGVIWKLDSRGVPVITFGSGGMRSGLFGAPADGSVASSTLRALLVDASGNVYAGGKSDAAVQCGRAAVVRLDSNGSTVQSFGNAGVFVVDMTNSEVQDLATDAAGRLYVALYSFPICPLPVRPVAPSFVVFRLTV